MMTYVYAITDRPEEPLPGQLGLDDADLTQIAWRDIGAVVSTYDGAELAATADELWRHEEVVEALMGRRAVLPVRFGTLFASDQQVGDMLARAYPQFIQDFARVRDHVEIGMRFLATAEDRSEAGVSPLRQADGAPPLDSSNDFPRPETAPGTAYLRTRLTRERTLRNRRQAQLTMVREVYATLASHATVGRMDAEPGDRQGVSAAFLVPRDRLASFRVILGRIADAHPELLLFCTGPWPPYSFVSANAGEPATGRGGNRHAH